MIKRIKEDNLIFAFMINIMALISSLIFFRPFFEENDDAFIAMIAEGAFGKRDFHVIYPNALYGKLLSLLSALFPALRWHSIIQYILVFGALTAISFLIFEYSKKRGLGILFILASFYELYVSLQYSKTALAASTAGFALILDEVLRAFDKGRRLDLKRLIPAFLLLFFGALLRDSSFFLAGIFALSALLTGVFSRLLKGEGRERMGLLTVNCLKAFLPIILLVFACIFYNKGLYDSDSEWKSFISYNKSRMELLDYRYDLMDFNGNEKLLREEGISENDALLYLTWQFGDDKVIPKEKMSGLVKKGEKRPFDISLLKAFAFNIYKDIFNITPLLVFTLMLIVLSFAEGFRRGKGGRLLLFETALFLCIYFMLLFYFQYSGRWSHRVVYASMIAMTVFLSLSFAREGIFEGSGIRVILGLLIFLDLGLLLGSHFEANDHARKGEDHRDFYEYVSDNKDKLFIADTFTFQNAFRYSVFKAEAEGSLDNYVAVGSWFVNSPITREITRRFGYENPFEALEAGDERVILADNLYSKEKVKFLQEHYRGDEKLEFLKEIGGIRLYRIR